MQFDFMKGSSSLLFLISTTKALYCSKLILWKIFNGLLVIASYLCNASGYNEPYLLLDYFAIFLVCTSYVNHYYINSLFILSAISEYITTSSIEHIKDITFATAVTKSIIYTYLYVDKLHFVIILTSTLSGVTIYAILYSLHNKKNNKYTLLLTYLFHICIMNILYITSITAI
jgi:hypothetical protein